MPVVVFIASEVSTTKMDIVPSHTGLFQLFDLLPQIIVKFVLLKYTCYAGIVLRGFGGCCEGHLY